MLVAAGLLSQPDPLEGSFPSRARRVHILASCSCACFAFLRLANKASMMSWLGERGCSVPARCCEMSFRYISALACRTL